MTAFLGQLFFSKSHPELKSFSDSLEGEWRMTNSAFAFVNINESVQRIMKLETIAIHGGYSPDPTTKAVAVPVYQTTSYAFDNTQHGADLFDLKVPGNIYTRIMNPTTDVLEKRVAALEGGIAGLAFASGMAAITAAIQTIAAAGDNIVTTSTLYGGTYNLFAHTLPQCNCP